MKHILFLVALAGIALSATAQNTNKVGYISTEYILKKIPAYKTAQDQLDKLSQQYEKEIETRYTALEELYKKYQADKVLLTDDMKQRRENEIITKEKETKELQRQYFGQDGTLDKKKTELLDPIIEQIKNAVKEVATQDGYAIIIDITSNPSVLYTAPRFDLSDKVLGKLGYK
ncbi:MAG: OmpH family outer membrane protein [Prevotellaceae bacterium]|jgi:outer membrane protein|nr:OmpH family outer membrane protein [Prevotellaceae bacterium]